MRILSPSSRRCPGWAPWTRISSPSSRRCPGWAYALRSVVRICPMLPFACVPPPVCWWVVWGGFVSGFVFWGGVLWFVLRGLWWCLGAVLLLVCLRGFLVCSWFSVLFVCGVLRALCGWFRSYLCCLSHACCSGGRGGSFIIVCCNWRLREMCYAQVFFIHDAVRGV